MDLQMGGKEWQERVGESERPTEGRVGEGTKQKKVEMKCGVIVEVVEAMEAMEAVEVVAVVEVVAAVEVVDIFIPR